MPALRFLGIALLFLQLVARSEVGLGFSPDFPVDTRYNFNTGGNVSGLFRVDTRFSGSWGSGVSGLFTVDTVTAAQPSVTVSGRITGDGNGLAGAPLARCISTAFKPPP